MFQEQKHYGPPFRFCTSFWRMFPSTLFSLVIALMLTAVVVMRLEEGLPVVEFDTPSHWLSAMIRVVGTPILYYSVYKRLKLGLSDKPLITVDENGWSSRYIVVQKINWSLIERVGIQRQMGNNVIGVVLKKPQVPTSGLKPNVAAKVTNQLKMHGMIGVAPEHLLPMKLEDIYHLVSPYVAQMVAKNAVPAQPPVAAPQLGID